MRRGVVLTYEWECDYCDTTAVVVGEGAPEGWRVFVQCGSVINCTCGCQEWADEYPAVDMGGSHPSIAFGQYAVRVSSNTVN